MSNFMVVYLEKNPRLATVQLNVTHLCCVLDNKRSKHHPAF